MTDEIERTINALRTVADTQQRHEDRYGAWKFLRRAANLLEKLAAELKEEKLQHQHTYEHAELFREEAEKLAVENYRLVKAIDKLEADHSVREEHNATW